ncbi:MULTISPECIES: proton extrusion protein PcxA [unclassified Coleofasciculus]|uniref:proton extrusion protein PcxA n=1 Tax=unclassified Coleofasciculus TaxID=2692782 RepID=UPI00187EAB56|nr:MULTISPECIES: proton extrusion protein PcxA [unclassified Coleofasciculus]MBE9127978.1 proton extrusion protein PcxA [Coleofasciculus sp. LEGE 07081]MBE9148163.1 proton extrusion protein PcxA [Coleofasciculus sp. LEGE 07092]
MKLQAIFRLANQWFSDTPDRALDQAYRAALMIKAIEDEHFNGQKISADSSNYSDSVLSYFDADLNKYLKTIKVRLTEFRAYRSVFNNLNSQGVETLNGETMTNFGRYEPVDLSEKQSIIVEKLDFIDKILRKYSPRPQLKRSVSLIPLSQTDVIKSNSKQVAGNNFRNDSRSWQDDRNVNGDPLEKIETISDKTGVVPRSILRTVSRLQRELDPKAEEEVVKKFRSSRDKTLISIKFILTLIIVPILTQQVTKTFLISPLVENFRREPEATIFLNIDMEEEALSELHRFEEELHFKSMLGLTPKLSEEALKEQVKEKAGELAEEYRSRSSNAIKNIFADLFSLLAFALVIVNSKPDLAILKSFMDDIVYGLSDSAKAFIIILFTDMFVGFHSPHGWEVILEAVSRHLGIPESRDFIFLFIATFPVILDSVIKYWIFRYLNRISPSAVATYRNMNE